MIWYDMRGAADETSSAAIDKAIQLVVWAPDVTDAAGDSNTMWSIQC